MSVIAVKLSGGKNAGVKYDWQNPYPDSIISSKEEKPHIQTHPPECVRYMALYMMGKSWSTIHYYMSHAHKHAWECDMYIP